MRAVVTGGSGFLGSTIARYLLEEGHEVTILDRVTPGTKGLPVDAPFVQGDIRDRDLLDRVFQGADEVYHLAGVLGTAELQESVRDAVDINVSGTVNVFEAATALGVPRLFYPGKPNVWLNTYTITKDAAEQFGRMFNGSGGTRICSLRYFNAYGPGQSLLPIRKIIPAFAVQAVRGLPLEVFGDGEQIVDMIYSYDIAALTVRFTRTERTDVVPDCGTGVQMSVNDVARSVNEYFGNQAGIRHLPMRPGETPNTVLTADTTALTGILGDLAVAPYESSLASTLDWYAKLPPELHDKTIAFYGWA
ncbi:NAD(P)-dependent oxidoreductase [Micromonospora sp. CPCC 206060]|uniref:NAD-dependent epimerase/dehydratase family protein n=1 Tax=Micromonospora sp. CPCC 206060 TaxID=3122406 RepID=UPI002FF365C7